MSHHSGRLVHHNEGIVFIENIEGDVLRSSLLGRRFGEGNVDDLARRYLMAGPGRFSVNPDKPFTDCPLNFVPGSVFNMVDKEEVEPFLLLARRNDYFLFGAH